MRINQKIALVASLLAAAPAMALAQGLQVGAPQFAGTAPNNGLYGVVVTLINVALTLAGLVAAVYLILGGIRYITSQGDEDQAETAKNTILYAVIGLIVIGLSAAIVNFVISAVVGRANL